MTGGGKGCTYFAATELARRCASLVLLQVLRGLDQLMISSTETQWSCGDAITMLRAFDRIVFSGMQYSYL